ncbi:hypothetical protein ACB094_03G091700 [Castanea mollissima]
MAADVPKVTISNGSQAMPLPVIGLGTATHPQVSETTKSAILDAIETGYRHFDTAFIYGSEQPLGEAIAEAIKTGLIKSRDELFITSKLWCSFANSELVVPAIKTSLNGEVKRLPIPKETIFPIDIKAVWEVMEECQNLGLTKAIGVSNFSTRRLDELLSLAKISPSVNQDFIQIKNRCLAHYSELNTYRVKNRLSSLISWSKDRKVVIIQLELVNLEKVSLRWVYEPGVSFVPKSFNKDRMKQNLEIFDWSLIEEELNKISKLPQRKGVPPSMILEPNDLMRAIVAEI